jgi:hypothetical protein
VQRQSREPDTKRRRISTEEEDGPSYISTSKSRSVTPSRRNIEQASLPAHVTIEDSDEEADKSYIQPKTRHAKTPPSQSQAPQEAIVIISDDENDQIVSRQNENATPAEAEDDDFSGDEGPNPVITLFIEPRIPNTKPLLVHRKYNQRMKDVRLAWCKHNDLTPAQTAETIFTWNDIRIFDVQSCKGLGIQVDEDGIPYILTEDDIPATLENVALVATTRKIMDEEKLKEKRRTDIISQEPDYTATPEPSLEKEYRVILRSKSYPEHKLRLKEVSSMSSGYFLVLTHYLGNHHGESGHRIPTSQWSSGQSDC